jgi:hypothetical protein
VFPFRVKRSQHFKHLPQLNPNGNPTAEEAVTLYRRDLIAGSLPFKIGDARRELKGKDLFAGVNPALPVMPMC